MTLATCRFGRSRVVHQLIAGRAAARPTLCGYPTLWADVVTYYDADTEPVTCATCRRVLDTAAPQRAGD